MANYIPEQGQLGSTSVAGMQIPIASPDSIADGRVATTSWLISMDELLASNIKDHEKESALLGFSGDASRQTASHSTGQLFTSGAVVLSDITVVIPNEISSATLEVKMNSGAVIALIKITRIGNVGDQKIPFQTIEFTNCRIQKMTQKLDTVEVVFRAESKTNTVFKINQATGANEGQAVSKYDYTTGTAE